MFRLLSLTLFRLLSLTYVVSTAITYFVNSYAAKGLSITLVELHALTNICTLSGGDCCGDMVHPTGGIGYPRMAKVRSSFYNEQH
jgi:hypothetical protein